KKGGIAGDNCHWTRQCLGEGAEVPELELVDESANAAFVSERRADGIERQGVRITSRAEASIPGQPADATAGTIRLRQVQPAGITQERAVLVKEGTTLRIQ